ncbi:aspartate--tRNA ligase [Mycoplasmoides alvi]|uniref:aspartate--tRNA ligase n=1 Tax=Mycoplasmoides alvi TaxID=78580 RepID=UPI0006963D2A|nr:aspartate--tRNA ligase [Mycoplasmoides alvi]
MIIENRIPIKSLNNTNLLNQDVCVAGWVKKNRKLGNLCFLTLWDSSGSIQIVDDSESSTFNLTNKLTRESVVMIAGKFQKRSNPNLDIPLGEYEIKINEVKVIAESKTPPLIIENETDALEDVRLKYRYLDLRRPIMQDKLKLRFRFLQNVRNFLDSKEFIEIETPNFTKPTPEGARDYIVPTRIGPNRFYALPQSPQLYKQLLMISGFERYFQIARCFRDEDGRKDRQPEHTQIDLEMSFVNENMIQKLIEEMFVYVFEKTLNIKLQTPFLKMKYKDAINIYGSDKPDIRFELKLENVTTYFIDSEFQIFKKIANENGCINLINLSGHHIDNKQIKYLEKIAKDNFANGLAWITYENNQIIDGSIKKFLDFEFIKKITNLSNKGSLLFIGHLKTLIVKKALGAVRNALNELYKLANNTYSFLWITDWPLYEWNDQIKKYESAHNLFTAPKDMNIQNISENDKENMLASSYDLVLNGFELGSGAIRIHNPQDQLTIMKSLNLSDDEIKIKFGFLLEAYEYGAPFHGGMGLGLDRILMIITNSQNIRDVIAFPKNAQGIDLMMDSPSEITDNDQLKDIFIEVKK